MSNSSGTRQTGETWAHLPHVLSVYTVNGSLRVLRCMLMTTLYKFKHTPKTRFLHHSCVYVGNSVEQIPKHDVPLTDNIIFCLLTHTYISMNHS